METNEWSIPRLLELSGGYWSICTVQAAVKLDVFSNLAEKPLSAAEVARRLSSDVRATQMLLNALAALNLLKKTGDTYQDTPFAVRFLSRNSAEYLGHIILHHHNLLPGWTKLDQAVQRGAPVRDSVAYEDNESVRENFLMGMFNLAMQIAPKIVPQIDLSGRSRLLDLGGGPGTYAIHFCLENPGLTAVVCDLPTTRSFAEGTVAQFELSHRISFEARDFETEELPGGFDVAWLSHILHSSGPEQCLLVLKKAASTLTPGGLLMVQEFILQDTMDAPVFPALFALNMLIGTQEGRAYAEGELRQMLTAAGLKDVKRLELQLPNGAGVIVGTVPG